VKRKKKRLSERICPRKGFSTTKESFEVLKMGGRTANNGKKGIRKGGVLQGWPSRYGEKGTTGGEERIGPSRSSYNLGSQHIGCRTLLKGGKRKEKITPLAKTGKRA